jgi:hypothetical protein
MSKYLAPWYKFYHWIAMLPGKISWSKKNAITDNDKMELAGLLSSGYYIILTGERHYLSSIIVSLLSWIKTGTWARYSHVLMNCDNITDPADTKSFKFMEATGVGVHYSTFDEIFHCDTVCLLSPKNVSNEDWTKIIDALLKQKGTPYDDLFDLSDSTHVSCVELVLNALEAADYEFVNLKDLIKQQGNLVPQMYRTCADFTVTYEK